MLQVPNKKKTITTSFSHSYVTSETLNNKMDVNCSNVHGLKTQKQIF